MRIEVVTNSLPETEVSNAESIDRMVSASRPFLGKDDLERAKAVVSNTLNAAGAESRRIILDKEEPLEFAVDAAAKALRTAQIDAEEIDFVLFGGVVRRYLAPSHASVVQAAIGAKEATCFDLSDSCAGWARAMQVAESLFAVNAFSKGLVISNETGMYKDFKGWEIPSPDQIEPLSSSFTIGEAATATLVTAEQPENFNFRTKTYGQHAGLAVLPVIDPGHYKEVNLQHHGRLKFETQASELTKQGLKRSLEFIKETDFFDDGPVDCFVVHAGAESSVEAFLKLSGAPVKQTVTTFRKYGNTVASSIPLGLSLAIEDGRIKRGDKVLLATAAAGISIVGATFAY